MRRTLTSAIAETREADTLSTLLRLARGDADEHVRGEAVGGFAYLAAEPDVAEVRSVLTTDSSDGVRRRGVRGIARRPASSSIPILLDLARSSPNAVIRTESVRALSQSSHPAAISYLTSVLAP
jgi:hypothetical protein